jgi:UDP-glucose 4-epimerase
VRVFDRNACPQEFDGAVDWIHGDFRDWNLVARAVEGVDTVYHLISSTVPGDQHVDVADEIRDNVISTLSLLQACNSGGAKRIVFCSSASVYGVQNVVPISETALTNPISVHGIHKLMVEKFLLLAEWESSIDVRIVRISNPYGPGQNIVGRQGFVAIAIGCLISGNALILRGGGDAVRDFIFVEDVAAAIAKAGSSNCKSGIYNIGSGQGCSLAEVVRLIELHSGRSINLKRLPARTVDIPVSILDTTCAYEELGFRSEVDLNDGIRKTLQYNGVQCA